MRIKVTGYFETEPMGKQAQNPESPTGLSAVGMEQLKWYQIKHLEDLTVEKVEEE